MCLHRVVPWPFSCPLLLLSDPTQALVGSILAALQVASPAQERAHTAGGKPCTVSRVTCAVLIAGRKLKCSVMVIPYQQQIVAISCVCVCVKGRH